MDILSYDGSNYSGGSRGGGYGGVSPPYFWTKLRPEGPKKTVFGVRPSLPLISRSRSGTKLYLFNNAFVWYIGIRWVKLTL